MRDKLMSANRRAEQFKRAILKKGATYDIISDITGISTRTLKRIASGETDPRFSDVIKISEATGVDIYQLACSDVEMNKYAIKDPHIGSTIIALSHLIDLISSMLIGNQQQVEYALNKEISSLNEKERQEQALMLLLNFKKDVEEKLQKSEEMIRNVEAIREVTMKNYDQRQIRFDAGERMLDSFKSEGRISDEEYQTSIERLNEREKQ